MSKPTLEGLHSPDGKSSTGLSENIIALLCYILGPYTWIMGLIFYNTERSSKYVKFHAVQAMILGIIASGIWLIFLIMGITTAFIGIGWVFMLLAWLVVTGGCLALCIYGIVTTYAKQDFVLPIIGEQAYAIVTK